MTPTTGTRSTNGGFGVGVRRAFATLAIGLFLCGAGSAANADPMNPVTPDDGLWYYYQAHLDEVHASGTTGSGVTIAVIDSPVNLDVPTLSGANVVLMPARCYSDAGTILSAASTDWDVAAHGTETVSLIVGTGEGYPGGVGVLGVAPEARVLFYPIYVTDRATQDRDTCRSSTGESVDRRSQIEQQIMQAVTDGAQIISVSISVGDYGDLNEAIAFALNSDVIVVASLSENRPDEDLYGEFPPGINNGVVSVLSGASDGSLQTVPGANDPDTNWLVDVVGPGVNILEQGSAAGTWEEQGFVSGQSFAAPIVAGELALVMQVFPSATPNQILQAMIHSTGSSGTSHDAERTFDFGYGIVNLETLLASNPFEYEDVNPFLDPAIHDYDIFGPSVEEIAHYARLASPTADFNDIPDEDRPTGAALPYSFILGGVIVVIVMILVVAAVVVVIVVKVVRGRKRARTRL